MSGFTHGYSAYHNHRCRCTECRTGHNTYMRAYKNRRSTTARIRRWARANGHTVSDRGRIPAEIVEAYRLAVGTAA